MKKQEEQQMKCKDIEAVITSFMCNISREVACNLLNMLCGTLRQLFIGCTLTGEEVANEKRVSVCVQCCLLGLEREAEKSFLLLVCLMLSIIMAWKLCRSVLSMN